ncbi:hypothetical protein C0995_013442 [Termitomyces sp. Mi166|nr:hypothetical protein C0995_013442 [Termitomyces sp. Mi166\
MEIELELTAPVMVPKTIVDPAPTLVSAAFKGKGKAKAMEDDDDEEDKATQRLREELENFVVPTKEKGQVNIGGTSDTGASAGEEWCSFKGKEKAKALITDSEQMGTKQAFKSKEVVDSNNNDEEEERVHVIKKIKCEHIKEPIGTSKRKETIELQAMVAPKTPMVEPSHQTLKPMVLIAGTPNSVPKPTAATPVPQPAPVKSAGKPAVKGGFVIKDPFMATEVAAGKVASTVTQETLQSEEDTGDENNNDKGSNNNEDDDDYAGDNDNDAAMDIDSGSLDVKISKVLHPEETQQKASTKVMVTDNVVLMPLTKPNKTPFSKLACTSEHILFLSMELLVPIQFQQNHPSVE